MRLSALSTRNHCLNTPHTCAERTVWWFIHGRHPWLPVFHKGKWVWVRGVERRA